MPTNLSERLGGQDDGIAEAEAREVGADDVEVADDDRRQACGIEVPRQASAIPSTVTRSTRGHELGEVIVGQIRRARAG